MPVWSHQITFTVERINYLHMQNSLQLTLSQCIPILIGISAFKKWIQLYNHELRPNFPVTLFLETLEFVMSNNIFQFDDTHWLQCKGTAMGMPTICAYATISFSLHERLILLPNFQHNLLYYKRYIDDIFAIWVDLPTHENQWSRFNDILNDFGTLK